ncbi:putative lipoprotein [Secundilactobacillus oryzae JCM 18671]|uniref:Putative lipoprotein n=1 Tax=Secundilactobacillus oryzae JCM 18671 TaxID=1291743 RepID=A0A081BHN6_9LACO|nr:putative lipoprotein [Secundilactobacillus oryzae JCM 18671]
MITGFVVIALILGGCQTKTQNKANSSSSDTKVAKKSKTARPKPSDITSTLNRIKGKFAEDQQTRTNGGELTYSSFYWKNSAWHWELISEKRGVIADGKVNSISIGKAGNPDNLRMVSSSGENYSLKLSVTGEFYTIQTTYKDIKGSYVVGDTDGKWTDSAPAKLQASWRSGFEKTRTVMGDDDSTYPYIKVTFSIMPDSLTGVNVLYKSDKKAKLEGNGWGINDHLMSKQVALNTYLLKSYSGNELFSVYKVEYVSSRKIRTRFGSKLVSLTKVGAGQSYAVSNSVGKDTTNLTKEQVKKWVWSDVRKNNEFTMADYYFEQFQKDGLLYIDVRENHDSKNMKAAGAAPSVSPRAALYRINENGQLEKYKITVDGDEWNVVSDDYSE